jgi:hypothetical protein
MKAYGKVDIWTHIFLTLALAGGEWSASLPGRFTSRVMSLRYTLDRRLGEPQSQSRRLEEEKILDPSETQTPNPRLSSP